MKSIQRSFVLIALASILLLSLVLGAVSVMSLVSKADADASIAMNLTCANEAGAIDQLLEGIEDAVDVEASYMRERYAGPSHLDEWSNEAEILFSSIAEQTNGAVSYFYQADGAAEPLKDFFYIRNSANGAFQEIQVEGAGGRPLGEAPEAQVGWDEGALRSGQALWLTPLAMDNLGLSMVTYMEPVFVDGEYLGVVGMGVDFHLITDQVESINAYKSGYGFLTDAKGNVMYHPTIPFGTNLSEDDEEVPAVDAAIAAGTTTDDVVVYRYHGADKRMAFHLLQNDMRLVLSVNADEIYADRDRLVASLLITTIIVGVLVAITVILSSRRTLRPLQELTEAAERVAAGDLSVPLPRAEVREVKSLVTAYKKTVGDLRERIATIDEIAHKDALTGFHNKGAFDEASAELDARIAAGEDVSFSLVMLDVNGLKPVNDTYGHEAGDELLQKAAAKIGEVFSGTSASFYRIGGDEFVVLIMGEAEYVSVVEGDGVSIACGVTSYQPGEDAGTAEVLARADKLMYENKRSARA